MRTTIDALVGRRGDVCDAETVEETLESARKIFADVSHVLKSEIERLYAMEIDPDDAAERERIKTIQDLIKQNQSALRTVLEMRNRLGHNTAEEKQRMIDLEAAREEIMRRIDRLSR